MKIRTKDGDVFHVNEYHFIHLYRNVNAGNIGESTELHVVLLDGFNDWKGLAAKAAESGAEFSYAKISWKKSGKEIFPAKGAAMARISGADVQTLASYLNDDVQIPKGKRTQDFARALSAIDQVKATPLTTVLAVQWPAKLPLGVRHKEGSSGSHHSEHFVWGAGGDPEYPHIHCFVSPEGEIYEALATLKPLHGEEKKRHLKFWSNLTVSRAEAEYSDEAVLTELEKVMKAVAFGGDIAEPAPARGKQKKAADTSDEPPAVVIDAKYAAYAKANKVEAAWVALAARTCNIAPDEIDDWELAVLVTMMESGT